MQQLHLYDPNWERIDQPVFAVQSYNTEQRLDGIGAFSVQVVATDLRAANIGKEQRMRLGRDTKNGVVQDIEGIIQRLQFGESSGGATLTVSGVDSLDELKRRSVLVNRAYTDETVATIVADLIALVPGWTAVCTSTIKTTLRFDAVSVLKALQVLCETTGLHLVRTASKEITIDAFGDSSELKVLSARNLTPALEANDDVALISNITIVETSDKIVNRIYLFGAGENLDSALTLATSTRTTPYTKQSTTVNGRTLYYLEDSASVSAYGLIEKVVQMREIAPLSNTVNDIKHAANALHDAGSVWLERASQPQTVYTLVASKVNKDVSAGQTLRLIYKDPIRRVAETGAELGVDPPRDIDDEFHIMSIKRQSGATGNQVTFTISNVDVYKETLAKTIIGSLEAIHHKGLMVQPSLNHYVYGPEQVLMNSSTAGKVQFPVSDAVTQINRVVMRVRTRPFVATATGAASGGGSTATSAGGGGSTQTSSSGGGSTQTSAGGGDHRHKMFDYQGSTTYSALNQYSSYKARQDSGGSAIFFSMAVSAAADLYTEDSSGTHTHNTTIPNHTHNTTFPNHTHNVTIPAHTHAQQYGIYQDNSRPASMTVKVNNTTVASGVGGTGSNYDNEFDITDEINAKSGGIHGTHTIDITCNSGQGEVIVEFDVYELITPFKLGA